MKALRLHAQAPIERRPLFFEEIPVPHPESGEILVQVEACGICRTDLHIIEGDLPLLRSPLVPGHQVVGKVTELGSGSTRFCVGDRVGIAWLAETCGECAYCQSGRENLCKTSRYTGYHRDGGMAEFTTVREQYAYTLPNDLSNIEAAPFLCAGIIGYRALKRSKVPPGGKLGIYGFGSSAHITAQIALKRGCQVHVATRGERHQQFACRLGATSACEVDKPISIEMDSIIVFTPVGESVPLALRSLRPGGTVAVAGIHLSDIPSMNYHECVFHEKELTSVEANTREDGRELFAEIGASIRPAVTTFRFAEANEALIALKNGEIEGTGVLVW